MSLLLHNPDLADLIRNDEHAQQLIADCEQRLAAENDHLRTPKVVLKWRMPDMLLTEPTANPYPTASLPLVMRDAVRAIARHVATSEGLAAQCAVAAAAFLAQTRVNAPHVSNPNGMPCSIYQLALGDSGERKSECYRLIFKTIEESERAARDSYAAELNELRRMQYGLSGRAKKELHASQATPHNPRGLYTDTTFEKIAADFIQGMASAAWFSDEGGIILAGHSMKADTVTATLGGLVKLFDNGKTERDRIGADAIVGAAYDRRFCMHMMAQEVAVRIALKDPLLQGQGFLPRFLFGAAPSLAGTRFVSIDTLSANADQDAAVQRYWHRCKEIAALRTYVDENGAVKPPVMQLSHDALLVWIDFYNGIEAQQGNLGEYGGQLKPFASRSGEIARRLAAVFALFDDEKEISAKTMVAACEVAGHSLTEWARYIGCDAADSNENLNALDLLRWLKQHPKVRTVRDFLRSGPRKFRSVSKARKYMTTLAAAGWLIFPNDDQAFEVNPHTPPERM